MTYDEFIRSTSHFNSLDTYSGTLRMAEMIGFGIPSIVYRGYQASEKLQEMHDSAIQSRTQLHNEAENAAQLEKLEDLKLSKRLERLKREKEIEQANKQHQLEMIALEHKEALARQEKEHQEKLKHLEAERKMEEGALKRQNDERLRYYAKLEKLGVDLTKVLCTENQRVDKSIRIETPQGSQGQAAAPSLILDLKDDPEGEADGKKL